MISKQSSIVTFITLFLICLVIGGCEKELGYDLPYAGDRLVIYGFLSPERVVSVKISKTYPPTGNYVFINGIAYATVSLFEEGVFVEELKHQEEGNYLSQSNFKPKVGKSYTVRVNAEGFADAWTLPERILESVAVDYFTFQDTVISPLNEDNPALTLSFGFKDIASSINYYSAQIEAFYQNKRLAVNTFDLERPMGVEDLCSFYSSYNTYLLNDICFEDTSFGMRLGVETKGSVQYETPPSWDTLQYYGNPQFDRVELYLNSITENYYQYLKTSYQPEGFEQAFIGPRPRHTNVQGGYGILAAYNQCKVKVW